MNRRRFLALLAGSLAAAGGFIGWRSSATAYYNGPVSDHFDGERFFIKGFTREKSRMDLLRWRLFGERAEWPESFPGNGPDKPPKRVEDGTIRVSYVGHASILLQTHGVNLLIDPVWSERASPFTWAGPKRVNDPGVALGDLPPVDAVLVSHNHYDHLDTATLRKLAQAGKPRFLAPLGNDAIMDVNEPGLTIRTETFDWGQSVDLGKGVKVHFEPIYHWSARGLTDRRKALWAAFVIETPSAKIYHIADTAYHTGEIFRQAREKHGPFKLAIIPIGAYEPRWFMKSNHVNPEEAVAIFRDCGAETALGHHWGTFQLTDEPIDEPPRLLAKALADSEIPSDRFLVKRPGEVVELPA